MPQPEPRGCIGFLFRLFAPKDGRGPAVEEPLPYRCSNCLLTPAERSFFGVLTHAVGQEYWLFVKVRALDLFFLPRGTANRQSHMNRIMQKHVDFVLCDLDTVRPLVAIELDDASHKGEKRMIRDAFMDRAFAAAGLPLLHVTAKAQYNSNELREKIHATMQARQ